MSVSASLTADSADSTAAAAPRVTRPGATVSDRFFALKATPPFDRLRDGELATIAEAAQGRYYSPGEVITGPTRPLQELHIFIGGRWRFEPDEAGDLPDDVIAGRVLGVLLLLFDAPIRGTVLTPTEGDGLQCLILTKAHFFTIVNECPALVAGFLDQYGAGDEHGGANATETFTVPDPLQILEGAVGFSAGDGIETGDGYPTPEAGMEQAARTTLEEGGDLSHLSDLNGLPKIGEREIGD